MRALLLEPSRGLVLADVPRPDTAGECLIRVTLAGICGTDMHLLDGYADFAGVPGHEFVGVVREAPPDDAHWVGRRVVGEINVGCGACTWCRRGIREHCPERTVLGIRGRHGAFAEYVSLPAANLHALPDTVDDETAVFAEPVAAACRILEQVPIEAATSVAVLGDGRLGILIAQVMRTRSEHVVLLGRHARKLDVARALGLEARTIDDHDSDMFDVVVEATGRVEGLGRALALVRPRGTVVLKSTFHGETTTPLWPAVVREITIVGSRCGPFVPALELLASGAVQTRPLIAATFALSDHEHAFAAARRELKVLLEPG